MKKSIPSLHNILIISLLSTTLVTINAEFVQSSDQHWLSDSNRNRNGLLKRWFENKRVDGSPGSHSAASKFEFLHANHQFKGCTDPSEPFQCPQSERCIALQFVCDGHPTDCPGNTDENEEICIAAKRPAKENIEKFLYAEYTLHGSKLFAFLFGENLSTLIEENNIFWFDTLASAFSVAKNLRSFAEKTSMSSDDMAYFRRIIETIHNGRLEEIPLFAQEAVNQGLASFIEKLYESGFMEQ